MLDGNIDDTTTKLHKHRIPPQDWKNPEQWSFLGFVLHMHETHCSCGAIERHSTVSRVFGHRTLTASWGRRLVEVNVPYLPLDEHCAIFETPIATQAVCFRCINSVPRPGFEVVTLRLASDTQNWYHALIEDKIAQRKTAAKAAAGGHTTTAKVVASDSDILSL
jgi:hypothetical protein